VLIAQKKAAKDQKVRRDLEALSEMSRIRIRNASGVFEVSLVKVSQLAIVALLFLTSSLCRSM
jgi:hypothetical protein